MDLRRLAIFLILSWAILTLWAKFFAPPMPTSSGGGGAAPAANVGGPGALPLTNGSGEPVAGVSAPTPNDDLAWEETVLLGEPGQQGHYQATFSSEGGTLSELRLAGYYDDGLLDASDQADPEHWVTLVAPVDTGERLVRSLELSAGPSAKDLVHGYQLETTHWAHQLLIEDGVTVGVQFLHQPDEEGALGFQKTIRVVPGTYELSIVLTLIGGSADPGTTHAGFVFKPAVGMPLSSDDAYYVEPKARACGRSNPGREPNLDSTSREDRGKERVGSFGVGQLLSFLGVDNKYFAMLLHPVEGESGQRGRDALEDASWFRLPDRQYGAENPEAGADVWRHVVAQAGLALSIPREGQRYDYEYRLYAGPKERKILEQHHADFDRLGRKDLGFFDGIASFLLGVLGFFQGIVGNWGMAIILLTLAVRLVLFPINRRSQTAMARHATKMKRVQPKLTELKEKHKKDPKKQREEQARIMQEEGAFPPLGGCLPIFIQIPIFFGLFSALRVSFDLRQASFLWIDDLSMPDRVARLASDGSRLPLIGSIEWLNVLPPAMVVLWIVQQKVMPKPTDEQALKMHKMMMWMPVIFGVFLYNYAAGLSLYMITTSLFGILEYTVVRRIWPIDDTEQPRKKSRFAAKWAEAAKRVQEEQRRRDQGGGAGKARRPGGKASAKSGGKTARKH